jgi:predicted O-methyltransferase YrrM
MGAQVDPGGRVVGLDFDAVKLEAARRDCASAGLGNVEFRAIDVTAWREPASYDLVYGRFILSHLADRRAVLRTGREALRSGGLLILEDIDFSGTTPARWWACRGSSRCEDGNRRDADRHSIH